MLAIPAALDASSLQQDGDLRQRLRAVAAHRPVRNAFLAALSLLTLIAFIGYTLRGDQTLVGYQRLPPYNGSAEQEQQAVGRARFHLLVPATSSNSDLCKLMLSAQVLGYPPPVLINVGHPEAEDAYQQHMGKVQGILDYLEAVEPSGVSQPFQEDVVLIVDGYDVWFQLRLEVLLKRYYAANEAADNRTASVYGQDLFREKDMRQTIIFGPDKMCWPRDVNRPACWAVPETTLPEYAFGPQTGLGQEEHDQPRWLNSGTILGPARDLRSFFRATLAEIARNYTVDSDQFYMAELFGRQEWARLQHKPELLKHMKDIRFGPEKDLPADWETPRLDPYTEVERTEYHVGIDYESGLFQTMAFYKPWLTWMTPRDGWISDADTAAAAQTTYSMVVPEDVLHSDPPFSAMKYADGEVDVETRTPWTDVQLLYNTVTHQIPAIFHLAGGPAEKPFRLYWWQNLWFQAYGGPLRSAALQHTYSDYEHPSTFNSTTVFKLLSTGRKKEVIGGYTWSHAEPAEADEIKLRGLGGAWADIAGGWFSWRGLCGMYEEDLFDVRGQEFSHPWLRPPVEKKEELPDEGGGDLGEQPNEEAADE